MPIDARGPHKSVETAEARRAPDDADSQSPGGNPGSSTSSASVGQMFDHVIIDVVDLDACRAFYDRALAPLGISVVMELDGRAAFGPESGRLQFWLVARALRARPAYTSPGRPPTVSQSMSSTSRRLRRAGATTAHRVSDPSTTRASTAPSSSTPMATTSRPSTTAPASETRIRP